MDKKKIMYDRVRCLLTPSSRSGETETDLPTLSAINKTAIIFDCFGSNPPFYYQVDIHLIPKKYKSASRSDVQTLQQTVHIVLCILLLLLVKYNTSLMI